MKTHVMNIQIRDIRPDERGAVLSLRQDTLYSKDYLPAALDSWLADPDVRIRVAVTETGEMVGAHAFQKLEDGQCWLSGLRVRPDARGQGVATRILQDAIELAANEGLHTLRYATAVDNEAMQQMSYTRKLRSRGLWLSFERIVEPSDCHLQGPRSARPEGVRAITTEDTPRILSLLGAGSRTLYVESWIWRALTQRSLDRLASEKRAFGCRAQTGGWAIALLGRVQGYVTEATIHSTDTLCAQSLIGFLRRTACEASTKNTLLFHIPQEDPSAVILGSLALHGEFRHVAELPHRIWELTL
jgi:GNAT superfamily N-acetyltransferase